MKITYGPNGSTSSSSRLWRECARMRRPNGPAVLRTATTTATGVRLLRDQPAAHRFADGGGSVRDPKRRVGAFKMAFDGCRTHVQFLGNLTGGVRLRSQL